MASLALMLKQKGYEVTGSDKNVYPPVSDILSDNNIKFYNSYNHQNLIDSSPNVIVIGNSVSRGNPEVEHILNNNLTYTSMPELIKTEFIHDRRSIVITGTHGKTTTTSLTTQIFDDAGKKPGFMIGGQPGNFKESGRISEGDAFIIEGDEYDTCFYDKRSKFFHYAPFHLVINNIEFDHGDIFMNLEEIIRSFSYLQRLVPQQGTILANGDDDNVRSIINHDYCRVITFGKNKDNDAVIKNIRKGGQSMETQFTLSWESKDYDFQIPLIGEFNVRNAVAAILLAFLDNISKESIDQALAKFISPRKRLRRITKNQSVILFEDFAHHPTAIQSTLSALKESFPESRILAAYEPRSNTSIRNFHQEKMPEAFSNADRVYIYRLHRGDTINTNDRLDINAIIEELNNKDIPANRFDQLSEIKQQILDETIPGDIVAIMSQGDFDGLAVSLSESLDAKFQTDH